jgi:lipopolysaccharide transport system permease protein
MKRSVPTIVIDGRRRAFDFGLAELREFGQLFFFLVWRDIKARYAQSVLGIGWALIQPALQMVVFTVIFGNLANISSDGIPYPIFSYSGLVAWTYFASSVSDATGSLVSNKSMVQKIYFPRLILPGSAVLARLLDFFVAMLLLIALMLWYSIPPTPWILALPLLVGMIMATAAGLGMWLGALAVLYRDVKYGLSFGIQILIYAAPVVYPISYIPERFRLIYAINPMVGVIEGFRASLLGTGPMPWDLIGVSALGAGLVLFLGAAYFRRQEHIFADVV